MLRPLECHKLCWLYVDRHYKLIEMLKIMIYLTLKSYFKIICWELQFVRFITVWEVHTDFNLF